MDFNETKTSGPPGQMVDDLEPYEEWDLVAWPKHGYSGDEFEQVFDRLRTPHIDGTPMRVGYVQKVTEDSVHVLEAEPSRYGEERIRDPSFQHAVPIRKEKIVAKKQREHNPRYQREKKKREEQRRHRQANLEWRELPAWKRWTLFLTGSKYDWIHSRITQIKENEE